jgi:Methylase involved in ubiquinone/menaquinone biosynthesis
VLDIGTGTGIWAIDLGDMYPGAEVIGTDITPIQPNWVPPNVRFEIDDANQEWTWPENEFDFIHLRTMLGTIADWKKFYQEAYRCCKPGGWLEHHEEEPKWTGYNGEVTEDSPMGQWYKVFSEGGKKFGRTFTLISEDVQKKYMEEAGFVDIQVKDFKVPLDDHTDDAKEKELGACFGMVLHADLEGEFIFFHDAMVTELC